VAFELKTLKTTKRLKLCQEAAEARNSPELSGVNSTRRRFTTIIEVRNPRTITVRGK
jgi:hypothetical protein